MYGPINIRFQLAVHIDTYSVEKVLLNFGKVNYNPTKAVEEVSLNKLIEGKSV